MAHPVAVEGVQTLYPPTSGWYELRIVLPGNLIQTRQIAVTVVPKPTAIPSATPFSTFTPSPPVIIQYFIADPQEIEVKQCTVITWKTGGSAVKVELFRGDQLVIPSAPLFGSAQDCLQIAGQVFYRLVVKSDSGQSVEQLLAVVVK